MITQNDGRGATEFRPAHFSLTGAVRDAHARHAGYTAGLHRRARFVDVSGPDFFSGDRREPKPAARGTYAGLNVEHESFPRLAAQRIVDLPDLGKLEQVLLDVPHAWYRIVETLALQGIALRIAKESDLETRRIELAKIPEGDLRDRVKAWLRSFYETKPWLAQSRKKGGYAHVK